AAFRGTVALTLEPGSFREETSMRPHLVVVLAREAERAPRPQRPAKVISLEARRQARVEAEKARRPPERPAA
ncbi:MAG TPA: hypothetical protein VFB26_03145, partial [Gaiellaceae bacterium]|nr:hypothetical protein [Gaiellaceae bacterium]